MTEAVAAMLAAGISLLGSIIMALVAWGWRAEIATLRDELAKVLAKPIPGGPVMSIARAPGGDGAKRTELVAKAAYYRAQAGVISDPGTAEGYRQKAREMEAEAAKLT